MQARPRFRAFLLLAIGLPAALLASRYLGDGESIGERAVADSMSKTDVSPLVPSDNPSDNPSKRLVETDDVVLSTKGPPAPAA